MPCNKSLDIQTDARNRLFTAFRVSGPALQHVAWQQKCYKKHIICSISCQQACLASCRQIPNMMRKHYYLQHFVIVGLPCNKSLAIPIDAKSILFTAFRVSRLAVQHVAIHQKWYQNELLTAFRVSRPDLQHVARYHNRTKDLYIIYSISCQPACLATCRPIFKTTQNTYYLQHFVRVGLPCNMSPDIRNSTKTYYLQHFASAGLPWNMSPDIRNDTKSILFTAFRVNHPALQHV